MKKIITILLTLLLVSGCSNSTLKKYNATATDIGFDTFVSFIAYTENEAKFEAYNSFLQQAFKRYDRMFDKYHTYQDINNIKTINDQAGIKPVKVDKEIIELLQLAKKYYELSDRKFDITMGAVLDIWHEYREAGTIANEKGDSAKLPSMSELKTANSYSGWDHIEINEGAGTVFIKQKNTALDVGGVAKGFTVEKIAQALEKKGLAHAIINAGGNVRLIGDKPGDDHWSVGLQIPDLKGMETDSLLSLKFKVPTSFVTSGDYQRYYMYNDQVMHHIIDPATLMPARYARSVTVVCNNSGIADILSTTLYSMSYTAGNKLLEQIKQAGIDAGAIWVYDDEVKPSNPDGIIEKSGYYIKTNISNNLID